MKTPRIVDFGMDIYEVFRSIANSAQSPLLLLVRLYWGWQFMQTGWGKLHNLPRITHYFVTLGVPYPAFTTPFVSGVEFFGGLLLILGLLSRPIGLVLSIDMLVAYWTADHQAWVSFFSDPGTFYAADPFTFLFASLIVLIFGAGIFSADAFLDQWMYSNFT